MRQVEVAHNKGWLQTGGQPCFREPHIDEATIANQQRVYNRTIARKLKQPMNDQMTHSRANFKAC